MLYRSIAVLVVGLAVWQPATAEDAAPDTPAACMKEGTAVPDAHLQIAKDIMAATKAPDRTMMAVDTMLPAIIDMIRKSTPGLGDEMVATFRTALREEMLKSLPELLNVEACVYAQHFSADELQGLVNFYKTALGQKMLAESPVIFKETYALGQAWGAKAGQEAAGRAIERLRKEGAKI